MKRRDLHQHVSGAVADLLVVPPDLASEGTHPSDCILLLKQWVSSTELAQPPLLVVPHARLKNLSPDGLTPLARNALPENALKEYRKTATKIADEPWRLNEGSHYLQDWADRNTAGKLDSPAPCDFVRQGRSSTEKAASVALPAGWENFAPGLPRVVEVTAAVNNARKRLQTTGGGQAAPSPASDSAPLGFASAEVPKKKPRPPDPVRKRPADASAPAQQTPAASGHQNNAAVDGCATTQAASSGWIWPEPPKDVNEAHWAAVASTYRSNAKSKIWGVDGPTKGCSKCRYSICGACVARREVWIAGVLADVRAKEVKSSLIACSLLVP